MTVLVLDEAHPGSSEKRYPIFQHSGEARPVAKITIETPSHIPHSDGDRDHCEHDPVRMIDTEECQPWCRTCSIEKEHPGLDEYPAHERKQARAKAYHYCPHCHMDESGNFKEAVEVFVRREGVGEDGQAYDEVIARTSLVSLDAVGESILHVERGAYVEDKDSISAHFAPRGPGHDLPAGFTVKVYLADQ